MEDFIKSISNYCVLNYILTGVVFLFFWKNMMPIQIEIDNNIIEDIFIYYFFGMLLSRVGSLLVEKIAIKFKFIAYSTCEDFVKAEKNDPKISLLLETNNIYRTNVAIFSSLFVIKTIFLFIGRSEMFINQIYTDSMFFYVLSFFLSITFLLSYRKQTLYIVKRINSAINK